MFDDDVDTAEAVLFHSISVLCTHASLPNIMKAKKKPLDEKSATDYGIDVTPRLSVIKTSEPASRAAGVKVADVSELIEKLKDEAGVL